MLNKIRKVFKPSIFISVVFLVLFFIRIPLFSVHTLYDYRFLRIGSKSAYAAYILWLWIIPGAILLWYLISGKKNRKKGRWISAAVYVVLIAISFFKLAVLTWLSPVYYSSTKDIDNLGKYDDYVEGSLTCVYETGLPEQAPEGVDDGKYFYWYWLGSGDHYFIMASWKYDRPEDLKKETERLNQYGYGIREGENCFTSYKNESVSEGITGFVSSVVVDWETNTIAYIIGENVLEEVFPKTLEDYYSKEYNESLILGL